MVAHVSQEPSRTTTAFNRWSIAALVMAAVSIVAIVFTGVPMLAVFAVGAGHVALHQIRGNGGQGHALAVAALVIGYGIAAWAVFGTIASLIRVAVA